MFKINPKHFIFSLCLFLLSASFAAFSQDHHEWSKNLTMYEVNVRQYTPEGTFAAVETHLARLQEMGVGILWFMPIYPIGQKNRLGSLGSYYSVRDYLAVNPEFGNINDFKSLVAQAHSRGMYVIIDWVANHTAWDCSLTLTHPEWYTHNANGDFVPPEGTNWPDVIELDYSQQELRDYMIDAMKYWIREADIDGFRCDAASMVPLDFWQTCIHELKKEKPALFMLAEADGAPYKNEGFDMTYSWGVYGFGGGVLKRIADGTGTATELKNYVANEVKQYSPDHYRMHFTSNHDENSWHGTVFELFGDAVESFTVLTMLLDGMPLIYSGQEAGLDKRLLFFDKDQIEWREHPFADLYSKLIRLRKESSALWSGSEFLSVNVLKNNRVYAFIRDHEKEKILAVFNLSDQQQTATLQGTAFIDTYRDVFSGETVMLTADSTLLLDPWAYRVLRTENSSGVGQIREKNPASFSLENFPNPFNPQTTICFDLPAPSEVTLMIYDVLGRAVRTLISGAASGGVHHVIWDGRNDAGLAVAGGLYLCRMDAGEFSQFHKVTFLK
jgi:cyclomaltodextrinase / maltogenic alpha-amylase / neopullulanase